MFSRYLYRNELKSEVQEELNDLHCDIIVPDTILHEQKSSSRVTAPRDANARMRFIMAPRSFERVLLAQGVFVVRLGAIHETFVPRKDPPPSYCTNMHNYCQKRHFPTRDEKHKSGNYELNTY